jgi:hypothetical protein
MLNEAVSNQWFWLAAAGFFIVLLGLLAAYNARRSQARAAKLDRDGWTATGRIDFIGPENPDPNASANFLLQAEDTRIVNSIGGVDHHEVRWRRATLNEAKKVVLAYHAQLKLAAAPAIPTAGATQADPEPPSLLPDHGQDEGAEPKSPSQTDNA